MQTETQLSWGQLDAFLGSLIYSLRLKYLTQMQNHVERIGTLSFEALDRVVRKFSSARQMRQWNGLTVSPLVLFACRETQSTSAIKRTLS